jgi:hypothetical protein
MGQQKILRTGVTAALGAVRRVHAPLFHNDPVRLFIPTMGTNTDGAGQCSQRGKPQSNGFTGSAAFVPWVSEPAFPDISYGIPVSNMPVGDPGVRYFRR